MSGSAPAARRQLTLPTSFAITAACSRGRGCAILLRPVTFGEPPLSKYSLTARSLPSIAACSS
eukprot:2232-Heterococcus_DN1.PRE.1